MLNLSLTSLSSTDELLNQAIATAEYYGFSPFDSVPKTRALRSNSATKLSPRDVTFVRRDERPLVPLLNSCAWGGLCAQGAPIFFWKQGASQKTGPSKHTTLELHILGVPSAIAEAMLITIAQAIARDVGLERQVVRLNSIGTHDSSARFVRELSAYLRKNAGSIAETILARLNDDPMGAFLTLAEKQNPIIMRAPQSMEFLNEEERKHLAQVLEFLEASNTYYELSPFVLGSRDCWTHTIFEIHGIHDSADISVPFARGGRYDRLASRTAGSQCTGAGMVLTFELTGTRVPKMQSVRQSDARPLYFAHLGVEAKRRALPVLESLRHAHIPVRQSLAHDHLSEQMAEAQALGTPHVMIMGYKEASEGTVLVRNMLTNAQNAIPQEELVGYLRRRKIAA